MGGDIWVESQLGKGSCFHFKLFFESFNESIEGEEDAKKKAEQRLRGVKILLVDDNDVNLFIAEKMLLKSGAQVIKAGNGQIAIDILRESQFDAILMDIQMPIMDGIEATQNIRKLKNGKDIPILAMTAHAYVETEKKYIEYDMNDFVLKPFDPQQLFDKIEKYT